MQKLLFKIWPGIIVLLLLTIVARTNVVAGTYLTGWDNLHPEFDFKTNILDRSIKGVWQYYQGLGVPSGNAHVADLPRQLVLWLGSFVVPNNLIRYGYHLLAWFVGGVGIYILLSSLLIRNIVGWKKQLLAMLGSIFYMFNLGTLQNFYAPYEAFSHFYMMLPWLLLVSWRYLEEGGRVKLLQLFLINLLAVPMAYIPTIFIVYLLVLTVIWAGDCLRNKMGNWKRVVISGLVILIVNSFWLLPFLHFVVNNSGRVAEAKINRIFTQEALLRNQEYGELKHSLILEGFWFDTTDLISPEGKHDFMMKPWIEYLNSVGVRPVMWMIVGMAIFGFVYGLLNRRRYAGVIFVLWLMGLFALVNDNWPSGVLFRLMQERLPLFSQVMRLPYTKFIVVVVIGYAIGLAWFGEVIMKYFRRLGFWLAMLMIVGILFVQKPVFDGNFFYKNLRISIPQEYFELFSFFQKEDRFRGRIANLPQPTFWGWSSYGWGYRGSGFPWYGVPQPMLDRNFDVWSPESEQYYAELNNAVYDNDNSELLLQVLNKYGVDYVWVDGWVINPQKPEMLDMSKVEKWLIEGGFTKTFEEGRQVVYKREIAVIQNGVNTLETVDKPWSGYRVVQVSGDTIGLGDYWRYKDRVFEKEALPLYLADRNDGQKLYGYEQGKLKTLYLGNIEIGKKYRLIEQFSDLKYDSRTWWIREIYIEYESKKGQKIKICLSKNDNSECYYVGVDENVSNYYRWGRFLINDTTSPEEITIQFNGDVKVRGLRIGYFNDPSDEILLSDLPNSIDSLIRLNLVTNSAQAKNCYLFGKGWFTREIKQEEGNNFVEYGAKDASSCESEEIGDSEVFASGGSISLNTRNISGRPIKFCLRHDPPGDCLVEEIVDDNHGNWITNTYLIPPITKLGKIYLEIDNYAVGREVRINDVGEVVLIGNTNLVDTREMGVINDLFYTNNQAYRTGWLAWNGKEFHKPLVVNGWSNGWEVNSKLKNQNSEQNNQESESETIWIFYWPQLLEYLGFGMLGITIWLVTRKNKASHKLV